MFEHCVSPAINSTECSSTARILQLSRMQSLQLEKSWTTNIDLIKMTVLRLSWLWEIVLESTMMRTFEQSVPSGLGCFQQILFCNCFKDSAEKKHLKIHSSTETQKNIQKIAIQRHSFALLWFAFFIFGNVYVIGFKANWPPDSQTPGPKVVKGSHSGPLGATVRGKLLGTDNHNYSPCQDRHTTCWRSCI